MAVTSGFTAEFEEGSGPHLPLRFAKTARLNPRRPDYPYRWISALLVRRRHWFRRSAGQRPPGDRAEDDEASGQRCRLRLLSQEEEHPDRVRDRLEHPHERRLRRRDVPDSANEERVRSREVKNSEEEIDRGGARGECQVRRHERKDGGRGDHVPPGDDRFGADAALAPEREHETREEETGKERDGVAGAAAGIELPHEKERHPGEGDRDRGDVTSPQRLPDDERGEQ